MQYVASSQLRATNSHGFTIIELMISLTVVSILVTVALPAYQGTVRKARRAEALVALTQVQLAQERFRADHNTYAASAAEMGLKLGEGGLTPRGNYAITIESANGSGYVASAVARGSQSGDRQCQALRLIANESGFIYASTDGDNREDKAGANRCWMR